MVQDPYSDKNGVLFNKAGITDAEKLREYEYHTVAGAQVALMNNPPKGNFDMEHLKAVHKGLFGGVYKWAGETRTVDIWKGNTTFAKASMIDGAGDKLFKQLANENHLKGLKPERFSARAAHYLGEVNALHPFREGNGRTQRVFMSMLADNAGYKLSWAGIPRDRMIQASIESFYGDNTRLEKMIHNGLSDKSLSLEKELVDHSKASPYQDREL